MCRKTIKNRKRITETKIIIPTTSQTLFTYHAISTFNWKRPKYHHSMSSICGITPNTNGWSISVCTPALFTSYPKFIISISRSKRRSISAWCGASWWYSFHCNSISNKFVRTQMTETVRFSLQQIVDVVNRSVFPKRRVNWWTFNVYRYRSDLSADFDDNFNCWREYIGNGIGTGVCKF